eukprot:Ihof_evm1s602 gene=Ihof_evmTU1s602
MSSQSLTTNPLTTENDLLDVNFDGYKLDYNSDIQTHRIPLTISPLRTACDSTHFTYKYLRAFELHNHLYPDPWREDTVYYVDVNLMVTRASCKVSNEIAIDTVCQLPSNHINNPTSSACDPRSPSLFCIDRNYALASDGMGDLSILRTTDHPEPWTVASAFPSVLSGRSFVVIGGGIDSDSGRMIAALWRVVDTNQSKCASTVMLVHLSMAEGEWAIDSMQELMGESSPQYISIDIIANQVAILSEKPYDSVVIDQPPSPLSTDEDSSVKQHPGLGSSHPYAWTQDDTSLTISIRLPVNTPTSSMCWSVTPQEMSFSLSDGTQFLPQAQLYGHVVPGECLWTRDGDYVDIHLEKTSGSGRWVQLLVGDHTPETMDPSDMRRALESLDKYTANELEGAVPMETCGPSFTEETEECDFSDSPPMNIYHYVMRLPSSDKCTLIGQTTLGTREWLFTSAQSNTANQSLGVKYNVDALCYTPLYTPTHGLLNPSQDLIHTNTFHALAYVVASKTAKKFLEGSMTNQYAAMCDVTQSVFVYHMPKQGMHVATQRLLPLDSTGDIIGFQ